MLKLSLFNEHYATFDMNIVLQTLFLSFGFLVNWHCCLCYCTYWGSSLFGYLVQLYWTTSIVMTLILFGNYGLVLKDVGELIQLYYA